MDNTGQKRPSENRPVYIVDVFRNLVNLVLRSSNTTSTLRVVNQWTSRKKGK